MPKPLCSVSSAPPRGACRDKAFPAPHHRADLHRPFPHQLSHEMNLLPRTRIQAAPPESSADPPANASSSSSPSPSPPTPIPDKSALLARIAKAKAYKTGGGLAQETASQSQPPLPSPLPSLPSERPLTDWGAVAAFIDSSGKVQGSSPSNSGYYNGQDGAAPMHMTEEEKERERVAEQERRERFKGASLKGREGTSTSADGEQVTNLIINATQAPGRGSASQAADSIRSVLDSKGSGLTDGVDLSTMSMEQISARKEAALKRLGVEILTVDPTYSPEMPADGSAGTITATTRMAGAAALLLGPQSSPFTLTPEGQAQLESGDGGMSGASQGEAAQGEGVEGEVYKPKVTTWGVFPRPKDISKEYGGGRNLAPGQELETKEQKAAREASYAAALRSYKQLAGLEIDPKAELEANELYQKGMELFAKAELQKSYDLFDEALKLVPIRSKVGGLAGIQKAVILDSTGYSEQAQKLYKQLQGHAVTQVSRRAKQLLFGFKASEFLKADTISYTARNKDFDRFFRALVDRNKIYAPTEEEKAADEKAAQLASFVAVLVTMGPIAFMYILVQGNAASSF